MNVIQTRDLLRGDNEHVFFKIKLGEGSFVDERTSIVIWDDANETLYAICMPDNTSLDTIYAYNSGVPIDKEPYQRNLKSDSWIYQVYAYKYDQIIGLVTVFNKEKTNEFIEAVASGDALEKIQQQFKRLTGRLDRVETYLCGDYSNTNKDYESNIY